MKLCLFALLVGFVIVSSAAAQDPEPCATPEACENEETEEFCIRERDKHALGCFEPEVWMLCRKCCDACFGFMNQELGKYVAALYEGNHIVTWDRLPFDSTGRGEFILYKNTKTGMKVNALFTRPAGVGNSVTTAVAAINSSGEPALQIAVKPDSEVVGEEVCEMLFWIGEEKVDIDAVQKPGGYRGLRKVLNIYEEDAYVIDLQSGARITISVRRQYRRGCYLARVQMTITAEQRDATGLLGTPDSNIYNDWPSKDGSDTSFPTTRSRRYLEPAYNYSTSNWCVRNQSEESIIHYDPDDLGDFDDYMNCDADYDGLEDFSSAKEVMKDVCGDHNYECLHDYISLNPLNLSRLWTRTNEMMAFIETNTVSRVEGLNVSPRGIPANTATKVRITVRLNETVDDLNGFALAELNQTDGLKPTGNVISFLSDDGNGEFGDSERLDNVYSKLFTVELENGHSRGFYVIPLIKGRFEDGWEHLMFALPDAVRGFSPESGRPNIANDDLSFERTILVNSVLDIHYIWPRDKRFVQTATTFFNVTTGSGCGENASGENTITEAPLATCDCDRTGFNKVTIDIDQAFARDEEAFNHSVKIKLYGIWRENDSGPIDITVIARRKKNGAEISGTFLTMSVTPRAQRGVRCVSENENNLLGTLTIDSIGTRHWLFTLEPEPQDDPEGAQVEEEERFLDPISVVHPGSQSICGLQ